MSLKMQGSPGVATHAAATATHAAATVPTAAPAIEAHGLSVAYGGTPALRSVDLTVQPGETVAVLGPSGSGKTTLLYAIAGFLPLAGGEIHLDGHLVGSVDASAPPEERPIAMVFQHYGLWPHLDALETVAYPMRRAGLGAEAARRESQVLLEQMQIGHLAQRRPAELSGGEQQRVGLARALARRPRVYLLDEPTAHLDTVLKSDLQSELSERLRKDGAAAVHATHDVEEALAVADRVVLLRDGEVVQVAPPQQVYGQPADEWAARLTGLASFIVGAPTNGAVDGTGTGRYLVRPDWVRFDGPIGAVVRDVRYRGTHTDYRLDGAQGEMRLREAGVPRYGVGAAVSYTIERVWRMPERR